MLGAMIWRQWPVSGVWAIGILVGIHILMSGWSMIILGTGARRFAGAIEDAVGVTVDKADDVIDEVMDKAEDVVEGVVDKAHDAAEVVGDAVGDAVEKA